MRSAPAAHRRRAKAETTASTNPTENGGGWAAICQATSGRSSDGHHQAQSGRDTPAGRRTSPPAAHDHRVEGRRGGAEGPPGPKAGGRAGRAKTTEPRHDPHAPPGGARAPEGQAPALPPECATNARYRIGETKHERNPARPRGDPSGVRGDVRRHWLTRRQRGGPGASAKRPPGSVAQGASGARAVQGPPLALHLAGRAAAAPGAERLGSQIVHPRLRGVRGRRL